MPQTIIVLDFGSQYTQVIARRIREANVYSVVPFDTSISEIRNLTGGYCSLVARSSCFDERGFQAKVCDFRIGRAGCWESVTACN